MEPGALVPTYTVAEFLTLDLDDEWRHELIDGRIVSMSPPGTRHQVLHGQLIGLVFVALQANRPGCFVRPQAGIAPDGLEGDSWLEADLAVSCGPMDPDNENGIAPRPILIVEVLSPTTDRKDKLRKLPLYKAIPSVWEIVYVESQTVAITVHRRTGDAWTAETLRAGATLRLDCIGLATPVAELYRGLGLGV